MPRLTPASLGKFCRELACELSPLEVLLQEWGVDSETYHRLKASPAFVREMKLVLSEMQELGADAGYIYRMKSLAEESIEDVIKILRDPATGVGTRVDLIKFISEMARVKEKPAAAGAPGRTGPSVVFHFGAGLPIQSMQVTAGEVLDAVPEVPPQVAIEPPTSGFPA